MFDGNGAVVDDDIVVDVAGRPLEVVVVVVVVIICIDDCDEENSVLFDGTSSTLAKFFITTDI
jgi:hypothetical protein